MLIPLKDEINEVEWTQMDAGKMRAVAQVRIEY
jgi:hypothetical protein